MKTLRSRWIRLLCRLLGHDERLRERADYARECADMKLREQEYRADRYARGVALPNKPPPFAPIAPQWEYRCARCGSRT